MDEDEEEEIPLDMEVDTLYIEFNICNSMRRLVNFTPFQGC